MTQDEWYRIGVREGFCSRSFCMTHDGPPLTDEEEADYEDGGDPCIHGVRLLVVIE